MQLAAIYNDWSQALVATSCLESYGLHPFIQNHEQLRVNPFKIIAFGGIRIFLPKDEIMLAKEILATQVDFEIIDYDPVKPIIWRRKFKALLFSNDVIFALIIFIPTLFVALLWLAWGLYIAIAGSWDHSSLLSERGIFTLLAWAMNFIPVTILLHAEYVAVPRLRRLKDKL
ncbi:MAG: hypothetical protein ABJN22_11295 [Litorimonas sp.]